MPGWTNKGKAQALARLFRGVALPTNYFAFLMTDATAPGPDTNTKADVTEVPSGNGYTTGGISLTKNTTDFDVLTEDDTNDRGLVQIKDLVWTASGGNLPASGTGARYLGLTDDNATQDSREIYHYWSLGSNRIVSDTQALTLQNAEIRIDES